VTLAVWVEQVEVAVVYFPVAVAVAAVRQSFVLPEELSRRRRADERTIVPCAEA
jgi:hypothetical protein